MSNSTQELGNVRSGSFSEYCQAVYGKAKEKAMWAKLLTVVGLAILTAYLSWLGITLNDAVLVWIPSTVYIAGLLIFVFYYSYVAWAEEVATVNDYSTAKVAFTKEGMRQGEYVSENGWAHHSIALKNISAASIHHPSVKLVAVKPQGSTPLPANLNLPVALHNKNDGFNENAKHPPLHPGDDPSVFDLVIWRTNGKTTEWRLIGVDLRTEQVTIPCGDYEVTVSVQGEDMLPTATQKFLIKNVDGKPHLEICDNQA